MVNLLKKIFFSLLIAGSLIQDVSLTYAEDVSLSLDISPRSGTLDDTFMFSVIIDGAAESEYPILNGGEEFEVDLIGPESSIQVVNGVISRKLIYRYRLTPTKIGTFKTPSVTLPVLGNKIKADGISVLVSKLMAIDPNEQDELFAKQSLNKESVYVGEQIINSLMAFSKPLPVEFNVDSFAYDGFWTQELGKIEKGETYIRNEKYTTVRVRKALFPLRSGTFTIPERKVKLKVRDKKRSSRSPFDMFGFDDPFFQQAFGGGIVEKTFRSNEITLKVLPLPKAPKKLVEETLDISPTIVGATSLSIEANDYGIKYGENKTVQVTIRSEGNINPITSLNMLNSQKVKVYEESPQTNQYEVAGKLVTEKLFKLSVVPQYGGKVKIKTPHIMFFNPESKTYEVAKDRDIEFEVTGGPVAPPEKAKLDSKTPKTETPLVKPSPNFTDQITYSEESFIQRFFRKYSLSFIFIIIASIAILFAVAKLLKIITQRKSSINLLKKRVNEATSIEQLAKSYREVVKNIVGFDVQTLSSEELKSIIRQRERQGEVAQNLTFRMQSVLDELDAYQFSGKEILQRDLDRLKEKISELVS